MAHQQQEATLAGARDAQMIRRMLRYLRPYRGHVLASLALTLLAAPLALAGPPLTKAAVDLYFAPDGARHAAGFALLIKRGADFFGLGGSPLHGIAFIAALFFLSNLAALFLMYAQGLLLQKLGQYVMRDLREDIFAQLQRLPVSFYDRNPVGRLMTRLTTDVEALNEMFTSGLISLCGDVAMALYIVVYMFKVNWRLALVTFLILPPLVALTFWFRRGTRRAFRDIRVRIAAVNAFLQERLSSMSVVQLFSAEEREFEKFRDINEAHRLANVNTVFYYAFFFPAVEVIAAVGIALIIWYGGLQVVAGAATIGTLIAFIQLARSFFGPISEMSEKLNVVQSALASSERIFALLDEPAAAGRALTGAAGEGLASAAAGAASKNRAGAGRIEFRNVWFAYDGQEWVLRDVSFTIEPGERVALVGHTGAGKSTIASLLLRFYEAQRGQVLFDGVDVRDIPLEELRSNFSIVLQDVFLFAGDVESNIRLGDSSISPERVRATAREVHADSFIERLPEGFATEVDERGAGLSFGQKQLICFARALAFDPRVLILDEATSSIDTETEHLIGDALDRLMSGRTSLVIAHRLSTVRSADKIIVLHNGEVRETGTHGELLAARGLYWRLHRLHFSRRDETAETDGGLPACEPDAYDLALSGAHDGR